MRAHQRLLIDPVPALAASDLLRHRAPDEQKRNTCDDPHRIKEERDDTDRLNESADASELILNLLRGDAHLWLRISRGFFSAFAAIQQAAREIIHWGLFLPNR